MLLEHFKLRSKCLSLFRQHDVPSAPFCPVRPLYEHAEAFESQFTRHVTKPRCSLPKEYLREFQISSQYVAEAVDAKPVVKVGPVDRAFMPCSDHRQVKQLPQFNPTCPISVVVKLAMNDVDCNACGGFGTRTFNPRNGNGRVISRNQPVGMTAFLINTGMKLDTQSSFVVSQDW